MEVSETNSTEVAASIAVKGNLTELERIVKEAQQNVVQCVKDSNLLPRGGGAFELYASYPAFARFMEEQEKRILLLLSRTVRSAGFRINDTSRIDDLDEFFDTIVEVNDRIFERTGILLDNLAKEGTEEGNIVPRIEPGAESTFIQAPSRYSALVARIKSPSNLSSVVSSPASSSTYLVEKPQFVYSLPIDNTHSKFLPKLRIKHHALKESSNLRIVDNTETGRFSDWSNDQGENANPYQRELEHFVVPGRQLELGSKVSVKTVEETDLVIVDTIEKLKELRDTLNSVPEFAVDLEHHDYRTFLGLTCLMQISTRFTDYIIDPFPIWNEMGILNEPFTNPKILKVFHGASYDILWLQRDFGIYCVNMFDTYFASEVLNFARHNLAYLVNTLCDVVLDKTLQKSDWRIRPLSEAHIDYARKDTHYLLQCYDKLKERLLSEGNERKNFLVHVYDKSKLLCMKAFEKPIFENEGFEALVKKRLNSQQRFALSALYKWRDERARAEDESPKYVLPDHMLLKIAEVLPRELQGILACCFPVPSFVKQELHILHHIIQEARDQPLIKAPLIAPSVAKLTFDGILAQLSKMTKLKALLKCHLDFSSTKFDESISTFAPTLEEGDGSESAGSKNSRAKLALGDSYDGEKFEVGNSVLQEGAEPLSKKVERVVNELDQWATPYECYKIALEQEEAKEKDRQEMEKTKAQEKKEMEKKSWTHHDPARKEEKTELSAANSETLLNTEQDTTTPGILPDMILTKKALRRKLKKQKRSATVQLSGVEEGASQAKKSKQRDWRDAEDSTEKVVNYEQFDSRKFYEKPREGGVYDPFRKGSKQKINRGGRFAGHFNRGRSRSRVPQAQAAFNRF